MSSVSAPSTAASWMPSWLSTQEAKATPTAKPGVVEEGRAIRVRAELVERMDGIYVARRGGWFAMPVTVTSTEVRQAVADLAAMGHSPRLPDGMVWTDDDGWHVPGQTKGQPISKVKPTKAEPGTTLF